jgi:hypothetical protein
VNNNQHYQAEFIKTIFGQAAPELNHDPYTQTALNIYSNNFIENGIRALSITYPTVEGFIGEDSFRMLSKRFLRFESKVSFDWAEYGQSLAHFIEQQEALDAYPFLSEVAVLDWAIHTTQRAKDKDFKPSSLAILETGDPSSLIFEAAPGLQVLKCCFPLVDLYRLIHDKHLQSEAGAIARQDLLKEITNSINAAINSANSRSLVVWRAEYKAQFEFVSDAEAAVMQKIRDKASVNSVIESISSQNLDLTTWLSKAISNKTIFAVV